MPDPTPLKTVIAQVLTQTAARQRPLHDLQRQWAKLAGRALAGHTKPVSLRRGTLYVHTDEPGTSFALTLEKAKLLKRLQTGRYGKIEEIVVTAGEVA